MQAESKRDANKLFHANGSKKKAGVVIFVLDKIDFKTKIVTKRKASHNDKRVNPTRRYNINTYMTK